MTSYIKKTSTLEFLHDLDRIEVPELINLRKYSAYLLFVRKVTFLDLREI